MRLTQYDKLPVEIHPDNAALGRAAAQAATRILSTAIAERGQANLIVATGNSQLSFYEALRGLGGLDWQKITMFHMDEYAGMTPDHPASFRRYLQERIVSHVHPAVFHGVRGDAPDIELECRRYADLLRAHPADLCCLGFGENGHLAFNDPPFALFDDPVWVKTVELAEASRRQQVGEGYFATLEAVPTHAITLTIPALLAARQVLAIVPEQRKAAAVRAALTGPVTADCPGSILRTISHARLFLDAESASLLPG